ncbi:MAG: CoA-binding protein [Peptostreptococcaceae bacterium]|nr:CoA-binding protein [Peptostreptococcaceae bacterium]
MELKNISEKMQKNIEEMLSKKRWAVYGISPDESKFGYKIPLRMLEHGYEIVGINKKYAGQDIGGIKVVSSLAEIEGSVDCIDVIVNPKISLQVIDEAKELGIRNLWFQPGTWDEEVLRKAEEADMSVVHEACVYAILGEN